MKRFKKQVYQGLKFLRVFHLVSNRNKDRVLILCYHGGSLGDEWTFNPKLFMRSQVFSSRITNLINYSYNFIALDDLFSANLEDIPEKSVCVTFDDGWDSTATELIPFLAERNIPSTLYLHTEKFMQQMPLHNVAIRYLVSKAGKFNIAEKDGLPWSGAAYNCQSPIDVNRLIFDMNSWVDDQGATKEQVYSVLRRIAIVLHAKGDGAKFDDKRFEYISPGDIHKLTDLNCSIELHGHRHSYPAGDPQAFSLDLRDCRNSILTSGLKAPNHYCYPSGKHDLAASKVLQENGVISATTCTPGFVNAKALANPHYLPRFLDGEDVSHVEFEAEISGVAEIFRKMRA